jgi:peptidoglycan/xylan/chitin deacetylase (PgdA/CDA1 family)
MERSGPGWPGAQRAAMCISIDIDGSFAERNYRDASDSYWISQPEYERTGLRRLLNLLADFDLQASFCWVGRCAEEMPDLVQDVVAGGHELALHGWDHRYLNRMEADEQLDDFLRTRETIERVAGVTPVGHKSPGWRFDETTHRIAQEIGLEWIMDIPRGDLPSFVSETSVKPSLVNLPPSFLWADYHWYVDNVASPNHVAGAWQEDLDQLRDEGGLMTLTLHPWVSGRPGPLRGVARFLDYAVSLGDIWIAPAGQIARWWRERAGSLTGDEKD